MLPEPRDPFALIVWENASYLVDDATRSRVCGSLRKQIGLDPAALLGAAPAKLQHAIRDGGMQPANRAAKVRRCAELALEYAENGLAKTLRALPLKNARALLKRFPGIGEPGADKVLLVCGLAKTPALESNGLRVLERLGYVAGETSYARMYRAAISSLNASGIAGMKAIEAFALLREHGRELCKRTSPVCPACPLRNQCAYARAAAQ